MSNSEDQNKQAVVFDFADEPVRAYTVFPKFSKAGAMQRFPDFAGIIKISHSFVKKFQNTPGVLRVEILQFPVGLDR